MSGSEPDVVWSITDDYFIKQYSSEGTDIGDADSNCTWSLFLHHDYISLQRFSISIVIQERTLQISALQSW